MAIFEVLLRQSYLGRSVINRWNYVGSGTPATVSESFGLTVAFGGIPDPITSEFPEASIMFDLAQIQHTELKYVELQVKNLYDVTDFYTAVYAPSQAGIQGGTAMSPFNAYPLQSSRVRTDVRRGSKRFCGVSEQYAETGGAIESSMIDLLDDLAEAMSAPLVYDDEGNTLTYTPAILSLEKHAPDVDHEDDWYSLYATEAEQLEHTAQGIAWVTVPNITTQNSRKR